MKVMKVNLYKIHKLIRQRNNRPSRCFFSGKMLEISSKLVKGAFRGDMSKQELLDLANDMILMEPHVTSNPRVSYSKKIFEAIKKNNYTVVLPVERAATWRENPLDVGYVYVATSKRRPGMVKLGSTNNPTVRSRKYEIKYGYPLDYYLSLKTHAPLNCEDKIKAEIREYRVSKNNTGESNEWYTISPERLAGIVKKHITPPPL